MSLPSIKLLQQAIYTLLNGDTTLMALVSKIYDYVPQQVSSYPYITIGNISASRMENANIEAMEVECQIICHSRGRGRKQNIEILDRIKLLLDSASLTMSGQELIWLRFTSEQVEQNDDALSWRGELIFNGVLQ